MFNNIALDVFIGLVFIFLLYSLLATIIQEFIATKLAFRAKVLEKAILRMLEDGKTTTRLQYGDRIQGFLHLIGLKNILKGKTIGPWFYAHPLIKYLAEDNYYSKPAYLDAENFSKVMIDLLKGFGFPESQAVQSIHNSIMEGRIYKLPINLVQSGPSAPEPDKANPAIKVLIEQNKITTSNDLMQFETVPINRNTALYLRSLWLEAGADVNLFRQKLENWFDDTMQRATGWYKRYTRMLLFFIGFIVAVAFNVDTIAIHRVLSKDKTAREGLVQMAVQNKDKLAGIVEQQRKGEAVSDTILRNTYGLVSKDAAEANSVLGLGRVWVDTCKMCENLETDSRYKNHLDSLHGIFDTAEGKIAAITIELDSLRKERELISLRDKSKPDSVLLQHIIGLNQLIARDSIEVIQYLQSPRVREYQDDMFFKSRCEFIKSARGQKWFVYAPNQAGNWETLLGWLITALAITLGAPFWFDLLSKLIKIRGTGTRISPTASDSGSDKPTAASSAPAPSAPVSVNVNSNTDGEAVG